MREELMGLSEVLKKHLSEQKTFVANPIRMKDIVAATEMAESLFPDAKITIEDDPLQLGALIIAIEDFDIAVRETKLFAAMIDKADNFEIYPTKDDNVRIAVLFNKALIRV